MNTKKLLVGTLVGGIAFFLLGFVTYAILLEGFFQAHAGSAVGAIKGDDEMQIWPLFLGNCSTAAFLSYVFLKWADISDFSSGASAGFILGLLTTLGFDLVMYDITNLSDMTATLVDPIVFGIISGIVGGLLGFLFGKME